MRDILGQLAGEIRVGVQQVKAAVGLLDEGATVPFIARYRKEVTGGLDDVQLRLLQERLTYLRELDARCEAIIQSVAEQGHLTPELEQALRMADTKQTLEDLYLPYKPKRRTKGTIAREAGLEPLADQIWADPTQSPEALAAPYVRAKDAIEGADFSSVAAVLDGARDILVERWAEDAAVLQELRQWLWAEGTMHSTLVDGKDPLNPDVAKYRDYFDYEEPVARVPSHRALAVFRGRAQDVLSVRLAQPEGPETSRASAETEARPAARGKAEPSLAEGRMALVLGWGHQGRAADDYLRKCVQWCWRVKLSLAMERDVFSRLREQAEAVAIKVFADNLRDLLLAAPAGARVVMGLDPGIRTGVKVAVVDTTGKLVETATVYPHEPRRDWEGALHTLAALCLRHGVQLIAIGNGTASRETDALAAELMARLASSGGPALQKVVVSESGASVYSASEYASQELPDVDVSLRGAASIARRLQDPLAELVKIDPKSIGVGQYQHDVNQSDLARTLDAVVEDCVNAVGVDLNTASVPLLSRVSGLSNAVARSVVRWRETHGAFDSRQDLLQVTGLGPKTFEQSAGFLRIRGGSNPLDMTGVHPETYPLVERILAQTERPITEVMGRTDWLRSQRAEQWVSPAFGLITVRDVLAELEKPGRDPRPEFRVARYSEGVSDISDLKEGMVLEGTVSNVAAFGAFVDLGVHQDGLVHVSQLSNQFVNDAREVVKTGDIVKVKVLEVDAARKRISLSMKLDAPSSSRKERDAQGGNRYVPASRAQHKAQSSRTGGSNPAPANAMAAAFAKLKRS